MSSTSDRRHESQTRTYERADSVVFLKTKERFGGLSNMASGFPLCVNSIRIRTSEALYQACRFPHLPGIQAEIIGQKSPMTAKMKSKPHRQNSRPDWDKVRVNIMRWCLRVKLAQNWGAFSRLLLETGDRPIVEQSRKDTFWGAKAVDDRTLIGMNVLGRLLMELREIVKSENRESLLRVWPIEIPDFCLGGRPIEMVTAPGVESPAVVASHADEPSTTHFSGTSGVQTSLFNRPVRPEAPRGRAVRAGVTGLKSYPAMKDSGVKWLGAVPQHWQVLPNRALFSEVRERDHPDEQMLSVTITKGVIPQRDLLSESSKKDSSSQDKAAYKLVRPGDVAYNKMRAWQGAVGVSPYRGIVSPAYVVQRPREEVDPRYFHYLLRIPAFATEAERWSYGITSDMWSLRPEHFKLIYSCRPPLAEQTTIVRFLDHTVRRIRRYIRAKQRLIELLEEQKQAIIHRAITRGLDPDVRLKPSGVEWLGNVPEDWEVVSLRHRYTQCLGKMLDSKRITGRHPMPYLRNTDVQWDQINVHDLPKMDIPPEEHERYTLRQGDLLVCEGGEVGRCALWLGELEICGFQKALHRLRPRDTQRDQSRYMYYALRAAASRGAFSDGHVSTISHLTGEKLRAHRFGFPSAQEQQAIVRFLDHALGDVSNTSDIARREIELLREYRTRLVSDVVTGKLDVREAAAGLPDQLEQCGLLDDVDGLVETAEEGLAEETGA